MTSLIKSIKKLHDKNLESIRPAAEVKALVKKGALLLDVRTRLETRMGIVPGATNISLFRLKRRLDELPKNRKIVTYCGTGARAGKAKDILEAAGFKAVNGGGYKAMLAAFAPK